MNTDMSTNVVLFQSSPEIEPALAAGTARDENCLQQAWAELTSRQRFPATEVRRVHSEWELSEADREFVDRTFPNIEVVTHNFARPEPHRWAEAIEEARISLEQEIEDRAFDEITKGIEGVLLPIMRTGDVNDAGPVPVAQLIPGQLYLVLATVTPTQDGLTVAEVGNLDVADTDDFLAKLETARGNLRDGLKSVYSDAPGVAGGMVEVSRARGFAASMVATPGFLGRMIDTIGTRRLVAALPSQHELAFAPADSGWASELRERVERSEARPGFLPTLMLFEPDGMSVLFQKSG
ncbi:hypothetical protein [Allokutzneria sp. NRRL B-24872]|uniref:hypothetical protein n=1 Tax=Allokutzneria sp. NRRL B-24872 TaxID=1137961 RepID=UPI000A3CE547|nr:hypothetical protein [Allokutzneria sp. NRRL B-24872]